MTLTDADLARLEALHKAATRPPWKYPHRTSPGVVMSKCGSLWNPSTGQVNEHADAALIAEYRNRTPDLVAELREARAALARVKALCEQFSDHTFTFEGRRAVMVEPILAAIEGASGE